MAEGTKLQFESPEDFLNRLKAAAVAADTTGDMAKYMAGVHVYLNGGVMVFEATDRYVLNRAMLELPGHRDELPFDFILMPGHVKEIKAQRFYRSLTLEVTDGGTWGGEEYAQLWMTGENRNGEIKELKLLAPVWRSYPKLGTLMIDSSTAVTVSSDPMVTHPRMFSPWILGVIGQTAKELKLDQRGAVHFWEDSTRRKAQVMWTLEEIPWFCGLIMPRRVTVYDFDRRLKDVLSSFPGPVEY